MPASDSRLKVWLAFWFAALFWGTSFLWIKIGLKDWNPISLVAFRLLIACGFFTIALLINRPRIKVSGQGWLVLAAVAAMNPGVPFLLITWAEVRIPTGVASILNATVPLFTLCIAPWFLKDEKATPSRVLGITVGFVGAGVLFSDEFRSGFGGHEFLLGQLAVFLASGLYGFSTVMLRRYGPKVPPLVQAAALNFFACILVWLQGLSSGELAVPPSSINWIALCWLAAFGSFGAYTLAMYVMQQRGATALSTINFAYPPMGLGLGMLFLKEPFSWNLVLGGSLILAGIALVNRRKRV